ncbi:MAG: neutral zinc metallopeptidase [Bacteroidota bacterium]
MRWQGRRQSDNVDDRRGGGGGGGMRRIGGGIGIGTILLAVITYFLGGDAFSVLLNGMQQPQAAPVEQSAPGPSDELSQFVKTVLADTEDVWNTQFPSQLNRQYEEPVLVLFSDKVRSACGFGSAASGPFYCPGDDKVYIDLSFYDELKNKFRAPGDFAMAYVVAHEVGHHIQNQLGISGQVSRQRGRISQEEYNKLSVRLELQADFLAGVWAHHAQATKNILEEGDIEEALRAAHAIGDDNIQKRMQGYVIPESFTHGSSEQRMRWFKKGLMTGDLKEGDTFAVSEREL